MTDRVPPHDLDAEGSVLCACLHDESGGALAEARSIVQAEDFYSRANNLIFAVICELADEGTPVTVAAVAKRLRDKHLLKAAGGAAYIAETITLTIPSVSDVKSYARVVADKARLRRAIKVAATLRAEAHTDLDDHERVQELLESFHTQLGEIAVDRAAVVDGLIPLIGPDAILADLSPPDYVVDCIVCPATLTEIVAYGSSGKSWLAVDMAVSVAAGQPWLERFACKSGAAVYLDYEAGLYEMRRRIKAVAGARGVRGLRPERLRLASMPPVYVSDSFKFARAIRPIADASDVIIVDTLRAASPGIDENDSRIRDGLDTLRRVGEATGCAFVVLAHAKKKGGDMSVSDPREAGRGSSAIFDAADTVLHVSYEEGKPLKLQQTKARLGRAVDPFLVSIEDANGGVTVRASDALEAAALTSAKFDEVCRVVLGAVSANPGASQGLIVERVQRRHTTVRAALEQLERNGAIENRGTLKAGEWFVRSRGGDAQ